MKPPVEVIYSVLAAAWGIARYMQTYIRTWQFQTSFFVATVFISIFSGLMFGKFAWVLGIEEEFWYIFAWMGGFMGTRALDFIEDFIKQKKWQR